MSEGSEDQESTWMHWISKGDQQTGEMVGREKKEKTRRAVRMQSGGWTGDAEGDGWGGMQKWGMGGVGWRGGWVGWDAEWGMGRVGCRVGDGWGGMEREAERVSAAGEWLGRVYIRKKNVQRTEMVSGQVHSLYLGLGFGGDWPLAPFPPLMDILQPQPASDSLN